MGAEVDWREERRARVHEGVNGGEVEGNVGAGWR